MQDPCKNCSSKVIDTYGYYCDWVCGARSAWANYQAGIKEVVSWIKKHDLIKPDKESMTQFESFYQIEAKELEEFKNAN